MSCLHICGAMDFFWHDMSWIYHGYWYGEACVTTTVDMECIVSMFLFRPAGMHNLTGHHYQHGDVLFEVECVDGQVILVFG